MISFDEPGDVCPVSLHGTCIADASSNHSCTLVLSSCQLKGHLRVYAWISDWSLVKPNESPKDSFVDFLGTVQLVSTVDRAIPILAQVEGTLSSIQRGSLRPGESRFYILDLSIISSSYRIFIKFNHDGKCGDIRMTFSFDSAPDDPSRGCGRVACTCSGCVASLDGCSAGFLPYGKLLLGVLVDARSPRAQAVNYDLIFASPSNSTILKNFECVSAVGAKWFTHYAPLKSDELLSVQLAPTTSMSQTVSETDQTLEEPEEINLLTGKPVVGHLSLPENTTRLYLSSDYLASPVCLDDYCTFEKSYPICRVVS
jgi:hypothetical protein